MILFSQTTISFLNRVKSYSKEILEDEMGLTFKRKRFLYQGFYIPIEFVVFEHTNLLGSFDYHSYRIGLNKSLMLSAKSKVIKNIIRHEIAHLITYIDHGPLVDPHGLEFKNVCK